LAAEVTGHYLEAQEILSQIIAMLDTEPHDPAVDRHARDLARAAALIRHGSLYVRLGDYAAGERAIDAGITILKQLDDPFNLGLALNFKAMFAHEGEDYEQERSLLQESIAHFTVAEDRWGQGYSLNDLGMATLMLGDADEARRLHQQALTIFGEIGDRRGMAFALHNLGLVALAADNLAEARERLSEALTIRRNLRHTWGVAVTLALLGRVLRAANRPDAALAHLREALTLAVDAQSIPAALGAAIELAALRLNGDAHERDHAARTLALALAHPALDALGRARAATLLATLEIPPPIPLLAPDWVTLPIAEQVRIVLGDGAELVRV
ncbi:MAG: tetratricopeptide repeat protein, partial [Thermomicrobiales bacterium]|nr:tetratricopeptide repeat protein [Thermomicrobiales bacterium]